MIRDGREAIRSWWSLPERKVGMMVEAKIGDQRSREVKKGDGEGFFWCKWRGRVSPQEAIRSGGQKDRRRESQAGEQTDNRGEIMNSTRLASLPDRSPTWYSDTAYELPQFRSVLGAWNISSTILSDLPLFLPLSSNTHTHVLLPHPTTIVTCLAKYRH